ncbi:putative carboxylesterase nap [Thermoflexales bacterium]|nr:putative carboxylesterase nap [Thermoflexales bacterium]
MAEASSLFKTSEGEAHYLAADDQVMAHWPVPFETVEVLTRWGSTHAIVSGSKDAPPLVLLPGNFASATMWHPNIADLSHLRRVYVCDIIGNLGKSRTIHYPHGQMKSACLCCTQSSLNSQ